MDKVSELRKALTQRGAKARIVREVGISPQALGKIQRGVAVPTTATRRLIARALGFPDDYFLEPDDQPERTARRRIVVELEVPDGFRLDDGRLYRIQRAMVDAGNHIIEVIKELDKDN